MSSAVLLGLVLAVAAPASAQRPLPPATSSSPIALSSDGRYVWNVNPSADNVTVIRASSGQVVRRIPVGDEPASVALDPGNRYAYVASPGDSRLTVIRITDRRPNSFRTQVTRRVTTGAENWNVVTSADGERVFVANSGQDSITVLNRRGRILGHVNLDRGRCSDPDRNRQFQPRGLAVTRDSSKLYVTGFFAFTRPGGRQGDDNGREGVVCRLNIDTDSEDIDDYRQFQRITIGPQVTGFNVDSTGDGVDDPTSAFPNQLQSIVIRGNYAFLPGIAASPSGPLRFNVDTQAFVNVLRGVNANQQSDDSADKFLNLNLGARTPEAGKKRLFFAGPWAIGFTRLSGAGNAYVVAQNSDLLVKVNVAGNGDLSFTGGDQTTRYIDLNDPANPQTSGNNAGKNPQGIVVNAAGTRAWVANFISRNVTQVDLRNDRVERVIRTAALPPAGSPQERVLVGAEIFFSSRGNFDRPPGTTVSTTERLSSEGWQSCSSCHFEGLTDSIVWTFNAGPRKSIPLNATFNPNNRSEQRVLNYSSIMDETQDFDQNARNISGPGNLAAAVPCNAPLAGQPATGLLNPNQGMTIGDNGDRNLAPCVLNNFVRPNAGRPNHTVTLPGSTVPVPALDAMNEWIREAIRTPNGPLSAQSARRDRPARPGLNRDLVQQGRQLFAQAGCTACHVGGLGTTSRKDFTSPPLAADVALEGAPAAQIGFLSRFLRNIGSFNLGVPGAGNELAANIGAVELTTQPLARNAAGQLQSGTAAAALGFDFNNDGRGNGYSPPSVLGLNVNPPYYHNGACETLACVVDNVKHRTANGTRADGLPDARQRRAVVEFLRSIDARNPAP